MATFSRRKSSYPLYTKAGTARTVIADAVVATIINPERIGGTIKSAGARTVPVNIAVKDLEHPYLYMHPFNRMTSGGTSKLFGKRRV